MRAVDVIRHKRDGRTLDREEIDFFVHGVTDGSFPDYQASALLMAILIRGMSAPETAALTDAMVRSGVRVDYPGVDGIPVDKHSTGGVGDKTSLILAPLAAACGAYVPMMSGRGLGHTGGTLDKLEAIPGFRTALSLEELRAALQDVGCALIGQTSEIAPADRILYALRDVTGTVESIPLICASIMSKKIAEGIGGLVLDVKTGVGAFMKTPEDVTPARRVARRHRRRLRRPHRGADHVDGRAARPDGRQLAGGHRVDRDAQRARPRRSGGTVGDAGGAHADDGADRATASRAAEARIRAALDSGAALE